MEKSSRPEAGPKCETPTKRCGGCKKTRPEDEFGLHRKHGRQTWCRSCMSWAQLSRKFGVSKDTFLRMLREQDGKCAICERQLGSVRIRRPDLDHDHKTGRIRGILCRNCNVVLGLMKDSPTRFEAAAAYLRKHGGDDMVPHSEESEEPG